MAGSKMESVIIDLTQLESGKIKPSLHQFKELGKSLFATDPLINQISVIGVKRFFYSMAYWEALFNGTVFDVPNLKIQTQGLSTASIKTLLMYTKRLRD